MTLVRVRHGKIRKGMKIRMMGTGATHVVERVGVFSPKLRREHANPFDDMRRAGAHHPDFHALPDLAVAHPHQRHHAEISVIPAGMTLISA